MYSACIYYLCKFFKISLKRTVSQDFGGLQMILMDVYFF